MNVSTLSEASLQVNDAPVIKWIRVQDAVKLLCPENAKRHDIGSIVASIQRYGFQELPKYDEIVGWIKVGNARIEGAALPAGYYNPRRIVQHH